LIGLHAAKKYGRGVIVEKFITGKDHRVFVVNYKFVAAAIRKPAAVKGDGKSTIQQLIDQHHQSKIREEDMVMRKCLTQITVDDFSDGNAQPRRVDARYGD
jgi:cyanophycin synthetase